MAFFSHRTRKTDDGSWKIELFSVSLALQAGDGAKILGENSLTLSQGQDAEVLLFDMDWDGK